MYSSMIKLGFWSETESDTASQIKKLPEIIIDSHPVTEPEQLMHDDPVAKNIYELLIPALKLIDEKSLSPCDSFQYTKVCDMTVAPKNNSTADPTSLALYLVCSKNLSKMNFYFLIDEKKEVAAYAHYSFLEQSPHLESVYSNVPFIALDAIESKRKEYSLGTLLMQVIVEHSLLAGCDGRISLFSASKSGGFYFKLGFTALNETTFDALFYEGQKEIDGGVMFLTSAAIEAWKERVSQHPLLANSSELQEDCKVNRV